MILAWFATVWGRRVLAIAGVAALLLGARWYFIKEGEANGRAVAARETQAQIESERADARQQVTETLNKTAAELEAAQQRFENAQAMLDKQQATISQLIGQRQQQQRATAAIPDQSLHDYNIKTLAIRKVDDVTVGYYASEERAIANCLSDRPLCEQENKANADALQTAKVQLASLQDKIRPMETRDAALLAYANTVEKLYVELYNSVPRKRNWFLTIVTFGIKGKPKVLSMPDPLVLQRRRQILFPETQ